MFGKKKRKPQCRAVATDAEGRIVLDAPAESLQLSEEAVIALSVEYFNDPEPCEIHREAVRWRAIQQLQEGRARDVDFPVTDLDEALRSLFPKGTRAIRLTESAP